MRTLRYLIVVSCLVGSQRSLAGTAVRRALDSYEKVRTLSCDVQRITQVEGDRKVRFLSRVFYKKGGFIHVDNASPVPRRIIADGKDLFSYVEGEKYGFSRPVDKLDADMARSLSKVPGSAMDHLLRMKDLEERDLPGDSKFPVRKGYAADKLYVVLCLDKSERIARIDFYETPKMQKRTATYNYRKFREVLPGVWIPTYQRASRVVGGVSSTETVRISNIHVNEPLANSLFMADMFFRDVSFVDNLREMYE